MTTRPSCRRGCSQRGNLHPAYQVVGESGPDHAKTFEVAVLLGETEVARASGSSKKGAEQLAARAALENLSPGTR